MKKTAVGKEMKNHNSASEILQRTLKAYHLDKKLAEYEAFPHWKEIVGQDVAEVATPLKFVRGNTLLIRVADAAWAQELSMRKVEILDKIHEASLGAVVEDLQFITGNPEAINS